MKSITILGIDPGTQVAGYGVISLSHDGMRHLGHGTIVMNSKMDFSHRLMELGKGVHQLLQSFQPQELSIEQVFLGRNTDSAFKLGHARGVVMYEARSHGCRVHEYATRSVKKGITGHGGAEKEEVRWILQKLFQTGPISSLDASDALALACHHATEFRKNLIMGRALQIN